jgi:protocatechuate 3,4-dioxygenase beta subunit
MSLSLFLLLVAQAAGDPPKTGATVAGAVTNALTNEPVRKATVRLIPTGGAQRQNRLPVPVDSEDDALRATSDSEGKFKMENVPAGRYAVVAERTGFVRTLGPAGGRRPGGAAGGSTATLTVGEGESLKSVSVKLTPQAVVAGRVLDEDGEPAENIMVQVMRYAYPQGRRSLVPAGGGQTNDLGEFRISGLNPGRYYLAAMAGGFRGFGRGSRRADAQVTTTFFPGAIDAGAAVPLDLGPGQEMRNLDIKLRKTTLFTVSGRIIGGSGNAREMMVVLQGRGTVFTPPVPGQVKGDAFEVRNVPPGSYTLFITQMNGGERRAPPVLAGPQGMAFGGGPGRGGLQGRLAIDVGNRDIDNLLVPLSAGSTITGTVRIAGVGAAAPPQGLRIQLLPAEAGLVFFAGNPRLQPDGTFTLADVPAGLYRLQVTGLAAGQYLEAARFGGDDVLENGLNNVTGGTLEITLATGAAEISGTVLGPDSQPLGNAVVVLMPKDEKPNRTDLVKNTTTDQKGAFRFTGVVPGEYRVFAWDEIDSGAWLDPEIRKPFEPQAKSISAKANGREDVQIKAIVN